MQNYRPKTPAAIAILLAMLVAACSQNERVSTLHATIIAVNAARDGFTAWDRDHQQSLVTAATTREDAEKAIAEYRVAQTKIVSGFEVAYRALAVAATQTDDLSLKAALTAAAELLDAIQKLKGELK